MNPGPLAPTGRQPAIHRGQAMVEYLVIGAIVLALIAFPIDGKDSVLTLMLDAIRTAYAKFLGALSLPQ